MLFICFGSFNDLLKQVNWAWMLQTKKLRHGVLPKFRWLHEVPQLVTSNYIHSAHRMLAGVPEAEACKCLHASDWSLARQSLPSGQSRLTNCSKGEGKRHLEQSSPEQTPWPSSTWSRPSFDLQISVCVCLVTQSYLTAVPWTAAHQAPLSMGLPFTPP